MSLRRKKDISIKDEQVDLLKHTTNVPHNIPTGFDEVSMDFWLLSKFWGSEGKYNLLKNAKARYFTTT